MNEEITRGDILALATAVAGGAGSAGPKGEPGIGLDSATSMKLGQGTHTVTLADTHVQVNNVTSIVADGGTYSLPTQTILPLVAGTGIKFEESEDHDKVIISENVIIRGVSTPTSDTVGFVGQLYLDMEHFDFYQCVAITEESGQKHYTWKTHDTHAEIVNIGRGQTTKDSYTYPTILKSDADEIYEKYMAGKHVRLKWEVYANIPAMFDVIFATFTTTYQFIAVINNQLVKYEWNTDTSESSNIIPSLITDQKYSHTINVEHINSSGVWRYQFSFSNNVSSQYTRLSQVGHYLYANKRGIRLPASGTYLSGNNMFIVTGVESVEDNFVNVHLLKLSDGTSSTMSSGMIEVTDYIQ